MTKLGARALWLIGLPLVFSTACARAPSPLVPGKSGSIGLPHRGTLTESASLPDSGKGWSRLRHNDRHYGTRTLVGAIEHAAGVVAAAYPSSVLVVGDLSAPHGGQVLPHLSHRSGRDADLLLYVSTEGGARITSPGFVHFTADGLAWDEPHKRFLRFDVEREWLLVKTLVEDDDASIQWIFANHVLEAMMIEWAIAKGEPRETILRAEQVLLEPHPGGAHDDHVHIRVACSDEEVALGCEPNGPTRPWLNSLSEEDPAISTNELVREISVPIPAKASSARD